MSLKLNYLNAGVNSQWLTHWADEQKWISIFIQCKNNAQKIIINIESYIGSDAYFLLANCAYMVGQVQE